MNETAFERAFGPSSTWSQQLLWGIVWLSFCLATAFVVKSICLAILKRVQHRTKNPLQRATNRTLAWAAGLGALTTAGSFTLPSFVFSAQVLRHSIGALNLLWIIAPLLLAFGLWDMVCDTLTNRAVGAPERAEKLLVPVMRKLVRATLLTGGFLLVLATLGVNVAGVVAGLGLGGIVVALAAKDSVENVFGSLSILFDMPFAIGDWVKIDKVDGVVEQINIRSTKIRTFEDTLITLPNANLIRAAVENYGARRQRRQRFTLRFKHSASPEGLQAFCDEFREFLLAEPRMNAKRVYVEVSEIEVSGIGVLVQWFVEVPDFTSEARFRHDALLLATRLASQNQIEFAEPAR